MAAAATPQNQQAAGPPTSEEVPSPARGLWLILSVLAVILAFRGYWHPQGPRPVTTAPAPLALQQAEEAELRQIPGLNRRGIQAILQAQQQGLPLHSAEDLEQLPGIGPSQREALRPYLASKGSPPPGARNEAPAAAPPVSSTRGTVRKIQPGEPPIHINHADQLELQRLPNIGPVLAQRIIAARSERPFTSVEDLRRVSGIGPKIVEKLRPFVIID
jgi:competence ComEA-like helix-hairpin-helix protein